MSQNDVRIGVGKKRRHISDKRIISSTDILNDFKRERNTSFTIYNVNVPIILVLKKNKSILENVKKWLEFNRNPNETVLTEPMLLVDDECDFASVNTADEDSDPTKINKAIRDIIGLFDKTAYVAYTATPFANIFINPEFGNDLYPKNFIHVLRSPQNYDGGGYFFANDGDTGILQTDMTDAEEAFPLAHKNYHDVPTCRLH